MAIGSSGSERGSNPGMERNFKGRGFQPGHPYYEGSGNKPGVKLPDLSTEAKKQRQNELIRYLLSGANLKEAAKAMNLHIATVSSYMKDPEVREQLRELHSGMLEQIDTQVVQAMRTKAEALEECSWLALERMKELLENPSTHPSVLAKMVDSALDRDLETSRSKKVDITSKSLTLKGEDLMAAVQGLKEIEERETRRKAEATQELRDVTP